jgi:hypothetical protein
MPIQDFLSEVKVLKVMDSQAAAQTDPASDIVDTQGYEGCCFVCKLGTVTDAGAVQMDIQQNTANSTVGMATLSGAQAAIAATDTDSEQVLAVDVKRPRERYLRALITRATQDSEIDSIVAYLYNPINIPVTQPATIDAEASVVSPAEA